MKSIVSFFCFSALLGFIFATSFEPLKSSWQAIGLVQAAPEKAGQKEFAPPVTDNLRDLFVELSKKMVPSVVNIYTTQTINSYGGNGMGGQQAELYKKFFENFFGEDFAPPPNSRKSTSLGTGFIIDEKEGLILTNYHVIADADVIKIILTEEDSDKEGIDAKVVGGDSEADVALLKIKTSRPLKAAALGDSEALQVGEWVMAVGNPFGHGHTVTKGIISAKERIVPLSNYSNYLQTDTPINPGNSGGPLINTAGQVIGINTAINAAAQGIGFAIPINYVKRLLPELRSKGAVTRGFIGINITEITPALAKNLNLKKVTRGVIVSEVFDGDPASKAGMQVYDVILEINGKKIGDGRQLVSSISSFAPGASIDIKVMRAGKETSLKVLVGKRPPRDSLSNSVIENKKGAKKMKPSVQIGFGVEELDSEVRRDLGLPGNVKGVVVSKVNPGSAAERVGLQRGDVIIEVDQKPTPDVASFNACFTGAKVYLLRFRRAEGIAIAPLDLSKGGTKGSAGADEDE